MPDAYNLKFPVTVKPDYPRLVDRTEHYGRHCTSAWFFTEGVGDKTFDSVWQYPATFNSTPTWEDEYPTQGGLRFGASGEYLSVNGPVPYAPKGFTIIMRMTIPSGSWIGSFDRTLYEWDTTNSYVELDINRKTSSTGNPRFRVNTAAASAELDTGNRWGSDDTGWQVGVYDGENVYVYVIKDDGVIDSTSSAYTTALTTGS